MDPNSVFGDILWVVEIATALLVLASKWVELRQSKQPQRSTEHVVSSPPECADRHSDVSENAQSTSPLQ